MKNGKIETSFDCTYLKNATKLSMLRTMIHESLHAWMVAVLRLKSKQGYTRSFSIAFDSYEEGNKLGKQHHEQIIHNHIALIVSVLSSFDKTCNSMKTQRSEGWKKLTIGSII